MAHQIHVEVFIAARLLARRRDTFTIEELQQEIDERFSDTRIEVKTHIAVHCVANEPKSADTVYNYLWRMNVDTLRLFQPLTDRPHPSRTHAIICPDANDFPAEYRSVLNLEELCQLTEMEERIEPDEGISLLYCLRSSRTNQDFQENLQILAAPIGTSLALSYPVRWITPELRDLTMHGRMICLVFSDRHDRAFVPVRQAQITEVSESDGTVTFLLTLGVFVQDASGPDLTWLDGLESFSLRFQALHKHRFYVVHDPYAQVSFVPEDQDNVVAWRRIINALRLLPGAQAGPYARTIFLRPLALTNADGETVSPGIPLEIGESYTQRLDCYAPHLTSDSLPMYRLILDAGPTRVPLPRELPLALDGEITLEICPIEPNEIQLDVWVKPDRAKSAALCLRYPVVLSTESSLLGEAIVLPEELEAPIALTDWHLRLIFDVLQMSCGPARDQALLELIKHVLAPLTRDPHILQEQRALILARLERWDEACAQFSALDPDWIDPQSIVVWFVSACHSQVDVDLSDILAHFNAWDQPALVMQLIEALPGLDEERRLRLLQDTWLRAGCYHEMWDAVSNTFTRPETVLQAARLMVDTNMYNILSPADGYRYLCGRMAALEQMPLGLLWQAVDWGLQEVDRSPGLGEATLELVKRLVKQKPDPLGIWVLVNRARDLSPQAWAEAANLLAEVLMERPEIGWRTEACRLYVELARTQRERLQDVDAAEASLSRAQFLVGDDPELAALVDEEHMRWTSVKERIEAVRAWWEDLQQIRIRRLHERLQRTEDKE